MFEPLFLLLPVYLLILLGFLVIRSGLVAPEALPQLSRFTLIVCIPVLVFSAVSSAGDLTTFNWVFIAGYATAALIALTITRVVLQRVFGLGAGQSWVVGLGGANPNTLFLGFPIAMVVFPDVVDRLFAWIMVVENMIVIPIGVTLADVMAQQAPQSLGASLRGTLKRTVSNPVVIGLIAGLVWAGTGWALPVPLDKTRSMIAAAAPVLSLFLVGGNVARSALSEVDLPVFFIAAMKLVVHPALAFVLLSLIPGLTHQMVLGATLFAAMPSFAIWVIFAARHRGETMASSALVVCTLAGAVSVGALVLWIS